jgi:hypothetical protein
MSVQEVARVPFENFGSGGCSGCVGFRYGREFVLTSARAPANGRAGGDQSVAERDDGENGVPAFTRKLSELETQHTAAAPAPAPPEPVRRTTPRRVVPKPNDDQRLDQLRARVNRQEQEIAGAKDQIQQTRTDLQGRLDSTRDELSGSIARTHDDLVALQKRGERNYYEFEADKSEQFQKVGPIRVSLRKVDVKHKKYDLVVMVDDFEIQKKGVNLFEPVWITGLDRPQPLELVVNRVHKDQIAGYLSEPKYKNSELTAASNAQAARESNSQR